MAFKGITAFVLGNNGEGGGGGGGTTNYNDLTNHPQINGNELTGNKTADQLGLLPSDTDIPTKLSDLDEDVTHRTVTDLEKQSWNNKVDSVAGKGLSTNDYTDEDKTALTNKVDKVTGKGLSTNDYTDGEKEDVAQVDGLVSSVGGLTSRVGIAEGKVRTLEGEMLSVQDALDTKVDKETGKGLSTNDYSNADKAIVDGVTTALAGKVDTSSIGTANGVAGLDNTGRVPSSQLPSYVDDVLEYASLSAFPATGEGGKIYIALDTNKTYRWSGSAYVEISESLALGETQGTAYEGNKGKANADAIDALETTVEAIPDQIETVVKDTVGFVGKNLFDGKATTVTDQYGVTWTVDPDDNNVVTVSGTPTGFKSFHISSINVLPAGSYKLSGLENTVNVSFNLLRLVKNGTTVRSIPDNMLDPLVIEQSDDYDTIVVELKRGVNGVTCSGTAYVMIRKAGVTDSTYEPYHESVQEMFDSLGESAYKDSISVVTDSSDLVESGAVYDALGFGNKNLSIPYTYSTGGSEFSLTYDNNKVTVNGTLGDTDILQPISSVARNNGYIFDLPAGTFTVSLTGDTVNLEPQIVKSDGSVLEGTTVTLDTPTTVFLRVMVKKNNTFNNQICYIQLEKGSTTTAYEPYHESVSDSLAEKADNSVIGTVEDGTNASKAWSVGEHFIKDGAFKEVTQPIASGGAINDSNTVDKPIADCLVKHEAFTITTNAGGLANLTNQDNRIILRIDSANGKICFPYRTSGGTNNIIVFNNDMTVAGNTAVSGTYYYI